VLRIDDTAKRAEIDLRLRGYHCNKLKSDEILVGRRHEGRTELAEIFDVVGEDVIVKLVAVSNGKEDRIEFADCADVVLGDGGEGDAKRGSGSGGHERGGENAGGADGQN